MAEGKTNMFGKTYNTIGSTDSNFIIKTRGDLKIQWGNKYIDLIKDGKVATKENSLLKKVDSEEDIKGNGIFIVDDQIWLNINGTKIQLNSAEQSYISFLQKQELKDNEKTLALSNIGFYYETMNDLVAANISSGIVYIKDEKSLYIIDDGNIVKYAVGNSASNEQILEILKIGNITISGEKISSDSQLILGVLDEQYIKLSGGSVIINKNLQIVNDLYIQSQGASQDEGFRLYNTDQGSTLEVDNIIWRNQKNQLRNYLGDKIIYSSKSNIISKIVSSEEYITPEEVEGYKVVCDLQYFNTFEAEEYIYSSISEETLQYIVTLSHEVLMEGGVKVFIKIKNNLIAPEDIKISITYNENITQEVTIPKGYKETSFIDNTITHFILTEWILLEGSDNTILEGNEESIPISKSQIKEYQILEIRDNTITVFIPKEDIIIFKDGITNQCVYKSNDQLIIVQDNNIKVLDRTVLVDKQVTDPDTGITKTIQVSDETIHTKIGFINIEEIESLTQCPTEEEEITQQQNYESSVKVGIYSDNFVGLNSKLYNPVFKKRCEGQYPKYDELLTIPKEDQFNEKYDQVIPNIGWIKQLLNTIIPTGTIVMWSGTEIPEGWAICDGNNGTPNLIGKFIKASDTANQTGGGGNHTIEENNNYVKLGIENLPDHTHDIPELTTTSNGSHTHEYNDEYTDWASGINNTYDVNYIEAAGENTLDSIGLKATNYSVNEGDFGRTTESDGSHSHTISATSTSGTTNANSTPFSIEPSYYSLIFIMKLPSNN